MKIRFLTALLFFSLSLTTFISSAELKIENWHDKQIQYKKNVLINNIGEMGLGITNIPESVNKRATCGNCHAKEEKLTGKKAHKERTLLVPTEKTLSTNLLERKNGGKLEFITSEYAKDFSNGPYQAAFVNDGITDSRRNPEFGNQPSFWGCDMLTKWKEPFPQEFIYSFKDYKKYIIDTFVLYNGAGGDGDGFDAEVKNFSLYVNSDPITPDEIYNVSDDGGGWSYNNGKFSYLSPNNVLGDGIFPSFQQPDQFKHETWIQSKNLEYTINSNRPKWVRIDFKKPTTISSVFITSDDSANVHNMETDIYKLRIVVITPTGEKVVLDNSRNQMVEDEFAKGYSAYFDPIEATGVIFKFYTDEYVEWQKIHIFKKPWKKVLSARAQQKFKDYSPEVFYFTPAEVQFLKVSIESNYGNPKWVDIGEMQVYNAYPNNLALYENGGRILDCSRVDQYIYGPNRLLDGKLLGDDEYAILKKNYVFGYEYQVYKNKNENDIHIILDLGKETVFGQINHYNTGDNGAKSVLIDYSLDNNTWEELGFCEKLNYTERDLPNKDSFIFSPVRARYIKFRYLPNSWMKNSLKIAEYEIFEVTPNYNEEGVFVSKVFDLKSDSVFEKLKVNANDLGKVPLNTEIKITVSSDRVPQFTDNRNVSTYQISPNETTEFDISQIHSGDRFVQLKFLLTTKDISVTPFLNNVVLEYTNLENVFAEASEFEKNNNFASARQVYEKIKSGKYEQGWILKADEGLVRINETINDSATKLMKQGDDLSIKEQFDDSIEVYRQVLRKYPTANLDDIVREKIKNASIGKEYLNAASLTQKRKYWKAVELYKEIIENYRGTEWAKKSQKALDEYYEMEARDMHDNANKLLKNKQFDEAQILFQQIKEKYSDWKWQESAKEGIALTIKGKSDKSLTDANNLFGKGNYEEARAVYRRILKDYPDTNAANKAWDGIKKSEDKIFERKFQAALKIKQNKQYNRAIEEFGLLVKEAKSTVWEKKANKEIDLCRQTLNAIYENEAKGIYDEALAIYKKGKEDSAYEKFEKVLKNYKGTKWEKEAKRNIDKIRSKRMFKEIKDDLNGTKIFEVLVKFEELKKISKDKVIVDDINGKLNKNVSKIFDAGKRYQREKEYERAYKVYYYIKMNYPGTDWSDRVMDRLRQVEQKLKE